MTDVTQTTTIPQDTSGVTGQPVWGVDPQQVVDSFQQIPADPMNPAQGGAFGGVPFDQQTSSNEGASMDFDISADDIPDFGSSQPSNTPSTSFEEQVAAPVLDSNPNVGEQNTVNTTDDISLDSLESFDEDTTPVVDPGFDPGVSLADDVGSEPITPSSDSIDLSGLDDVSVSSPDVVVSDQEANEENTEDEVKEENVLEPATESETVYDQGLAQEERDIQKDEVKTDQSKMVGKFYELTALVNQWLETSKDKTFAVTGHATDAERVEYRFVPVKNVDAGFKIEKHLTAKQERSEAIDVLTMTYKEAFKSLRLYMNGEMLYQEVKGDDKDDENRHVILDKINKFLLLVDEYVKKASEAAKEEEKKKALTWKLRDF